MTRLQARSIAARGPSRGGTLLEFTLVAPVITLAGLLTLQWVLGFHARNQLQHAGFMAARAGATAQAQPQAIEDAYARALVPLYGGGRNPLEIEASEARARADLAGSTRIEILNPSAESFADWADPALQQRLRAARRVIPNEGLTVLSGDRARQVGAQSGQTLADANQLQIRITTGLPLQVPFAAPLIRQVLRWTDRGSDAFVSALIADGRLPSSVDVMVRMQSPAMESDATRATADRAIGEAPHAAGRETFDALPQACSTVGCGNGSLVGARSGLSAAPSTSVAASPVGAAPPVSPDAGDVTSDLLFCPFPG